MLHDHTPNYAYQVDDIFSIVHDNLLNVIQENKEFILNTEGNDFDFIDTH